MALVDGSNVSVNYSGFTSNRAHGNGGVIHLQQSNADIFNSTFSSSLLAETDELH